jgi:predicted translin family RNA/ssDNA-binding protein
MTVVVPLTESDYILGLFDMTGEVMRFAITAMATNGEVPRGGDDDGDDDESRRNLLDDLRHIRWLLQDLDGPRGRLRQDMEKKMEVLEACVRKVENARYGLTVRGAERPKGWLPPDERSGMGEEIASY